jgi:DivIVA domain-containing protein
MPELDLPLQPSAEQIRRREFATIRRGYDPDQVRDYLLAVADQLEALERDQRDVRIEQETARVPMTPTPAAQADPYETFAKKFAGLLATADKEAERLVEEAGSESSRIVDEARTDADRIRLDAQARAEEARAEGTRLLEEARAEADRALTGLAGRRQQLVDQLQTMQSRLLSAAQDLEIVIEEPKEELPEPIAEAEANAKAAVMAGSGARKRSTTTSDEPALDPRYEDLWVERDTPVDLPDLTSIEFDFGTDDQPDSG